MAVEAVIFDIGNVLIEWQPERFYDSEIGEARRREMFAQIDLHDMNNDVDLGGPFRETIYGTADKYPKWRNEIRMWHDRWFELATPAIDHSVHLLRALRAKGVTVFALTNLGDEIFARAQKHYTFLQDFDQFYVSGEMKLVKPDDAIYAAVEAACGHAPDTLLFADDRQENLDAASARGWQTHHFQHPQGWADRLVSEGLLTREEATWPEAEKDKT
ncbi:HAD-IA family hydrolase [Halocynthiibacter styelae]|uniref:HAD-IA family hydrolase n=1 Tax=Halocynthiibacter styelae TaxID=2761955 RepID=A0A8J7LX22_9RHOB|nr:HAD-IA family hydrolase [Paenihalocynthiibacter styelae]MBI1495157.1 HAD-IA family hydrolase [Paenihalocynthiibacter styelae]